jgi:hypothetical protein
MKRKSLALTKFVLITALSVFAQSSGQKSFDLVKSLTGNWEGTSSMSGPVKVSYRVTAGGTALPAKFRPR